MTNLCNDLGSSSKRKGKFHSFACTPSVIIGQAIIYTFVLFFLKDLKRSGH